MNNSGDEDTQRTISVQAGSDYRVTGTHLHVVRDSALSGADNKKYRDS